MTKSNKVWRVFDRLKRLVGKKCICCGSRNIERAHKGSYFCHDCEVHFLPNDIVSGGALND